jgi:nitroimidazol reductase NimA-like FMN-containing flavoprotein (pyridoxamine 5'-phosphate oxidase superfamily)
MRNEKMKMPREGAEAVMDSCPFFVMATVGPEGEPYCVPLCIAREGEWLYFHSALEGHKIDNLRNNNRVCITCVGETRIPLGRFNIEYESVVIFGKAQELVSRDEKIHGLRIISQRYTPDNMADFEAAIERSLDRTAVWKIHIDEISGKKSKYD